MDRRNFLLKSTSFLLGSLFGLNAFSKALAFQEAENSSPSQPHIALIIDDIGVAYCHARPFLELGIPMTFAILPRLPKTHNLALEIHNQGHEIMLHQPMEPFQSDIDPGPGALYVGDGINRIAETMEENISDVPFAVGVNNHMGSRFTTCQREMREVLEVIKSKELFFLDSLTTNRSKGYGTAKRLEITTARRDIFLDHRLEESAILSQLHRLKRIALKYGRGIGIGHPFPETARALKVFLSDNYPPDLSFVHMSQVM
ncbi:MAG: divergent polysaccharide deacetylase family protein [Deltaproteobacteria bacterium]|nr:MAG: divergent polysaccharide deacetylase family protein [Deltaproteobacteria bacterium]